MTEEQFERELSYQMGVVLLQTLKTTGMINDAKARQINRKLNEEFQPVIGRFYLLSSLFRGNM